MSAAVRRICIAAVIAACAAPSAAANIWPRLTHIWTKGAGDGEIAILITLTLTALIMVAVGFAMRNADTLLFWLTCLVVGLGFGCLNYWFATEVATSFRNALASPAAVKQLRAAALERQITAAATAAGQLPQLPHTTAAMVTAAKGVADAAKVAREEECKNRGKPGPLCRDREADERKALGELAEAEKNAANTKAHADYAVEIKAAEKEKLDLGVIPTDVDPNAANFGKLLARFIDMGPRPDLVVMEWVPRVIAGAIELVGLVGPRILLTALGLLERRPAAAPAAAVGIAAVSKGAATAAKPKISKQIKPAAVGDAESVRQWFKSRTIQRADSRLKPKVEAYEGSYVSWCAEQTPAIEPVTFTAFGTIIKASVSEGGCGVVLEQNDSKRNHYLGIALVGAPKLVASASAARLGPMARVANPT